jgi:hypothetical protein
MYRALGGVGVVVGLAVLSWGAAPAPKQPMAMAQKVNQRPNFNGIDDARATLNDALEQLSKLYDVSFDFNDKAFEMDQLKDVRRTPIADSTPIPPMKSVRLSRLLGTILQRVPAASGATYTVREDHIEITTTTFQRAEIWGSYQGPFLPLVNATLDKCPLEDAVRQLADQAEFTVLVDRRAAEKAKTPLSARLLNTPLDTALRLLTDMADLRTVQLDNVLYVTTTENADTLEKRLEKEKGPAEDQAGPPEGLMQGEWRKGSRQPIIGPMGVPQ